MNNTFSTTIYVLFCSTVVFCFICIASHCYVMSLLCLCAFVTLNKRLLTYLLILLYVTTYSNTSGDSSVLLVCRPASSPIHWPWPRAGCQAVSTVSVAAGGLLGCYTTYLEQYVWTDDVVSAGSLSHGLRTAILKTFLRPQSFNSWGHVFQSSSLDNITARPGPKIVLESLVLAAADRGNVMRPMPRLGTWDVLNLLMYTDSSGLRGSICNLDH